MNILNKDVWDIILGILEREPSNLEYICCKYLYELYKQRKERYLKEFLLQDTDFNNRLLIQSLRKEKKLDLYSIKKYKEILYMKMGNDKNWLLLLINIPKVNILPILKQLNVTRIDELLKLPLSIFFEIIRDEYFYKSIELIKDNVPGNIHPNLIALSLAVCNGDIVNTIIFLNYSYKRFENTIS